MKNYSVQTYTKGERIARADGLADVIMDVISYHFDEIAGEEPYCVRALTMKEVARRLRDDARA